MAKTKKTVDMHPTIDVVAAACAAQRVNGQYVKQLYQPNKEMYNKTNRELVYSFLKDQTAILEVDRQMAENIKQFYKGYTFKLLSGDYLSEFDRNIMKILEEESCAEKGFNIALLASVPQTYLRAVAREQADRRTRFAQGGYVGKVGERLNLQVEVIKCVFSKKWGIFYVTAMTTSDQAVFFGYKQEVTVGSVLNIDGTVKRQDNNQTQLNRVKVK